MRFLPPKLAPHARYLAYLLRHKWFVLVAGVRLRVPLWRLVVHDASKFLPDEWNAFVEQFYGSGDRDRARGEFLLACRRHYRRNPHHWQHWVTPTTRLMRMGVAMPETYVREMVADWIGAAKAQGNGPVAEWWKKNSASIDIDFSTRRFVDFLVERATEEGIG